MENKKSLSPFIEMITGHKPEPHQKTLLESIVKQVSENDYKVNLMPMPKAYLGKYAPSVTVDTLTKLKKDLEAPEGSFIMHSTVGLPVKGLQGLKAEMVIIDEFHEIAEQELEKQFFKNMAFGYKIITDPNFDDYDKIKLTWKERIFGFKWFTKYKKVYNPKMIQDKEGRIYCSPRTAAELKQYL